MSEDKAAAGLDVIDGFRLARQELEIERTSLLAQRVKNKEQHDLTRAKIDDRLDEIALAIGGDKPKRKPRTPKAKGT